MRRQAEHLLARLTPAALAVRRVSWRVMRPLTLGVRSLVLRDDEILLVRNHGRQKWHMPGGGVERGELLTDAARREAWEETGWRVEVGPLLGMYTSFSEGKSDHIAIFVCRPLAQTPLRLNFEIAEARFFPLHTLPICYGAVHRRLVDLASGQTGLNGLW